MHHHTHNPYHAGDYLLARIHALVIRQWESEVIRGRNV